MPSDESAKIFSVGNYFGAHYFVKVVDNKIADIINVVSLEHLSMFVCPCNKLCLRTHKVGDMWPRLPSMSMEEHHEDHADTNNPTSRSDSLKKLSLDTQRHILAGRRLAYLHEEGWTEGFIVYTAPSGDEYHGTVPEGGLFAQPTEVRVTQHKLESTNPATKVLSKVVAIASVGPTIKDFWVKITESDGTVLRSSCDEDMLPEIEQRYGFIWDTS